MFPYTIERIFSPDAIIFWMIIGKYKKVWYSLADSVSTRLLKQSYKVFGQRKYHLTSLLFFITNI